MTRMYDWLCLNGTEVASADRANDYIRAGLVPGWAASNCYVCDTIREDEVYVDPATDDAPWYDPAVSASTEFFGIIPTKVELLTVLNRTVINKVNGGGIVGPMIPKPRVLQFTGLMAASSQAGMAYGDRWLNEVLSGSSCGSDEAMILPACPTDEYQEELYLRRLLDVGVVDGPAFTPVTNLPECKIVQVAFQLAAGQPYLFSPEILCTDNVALSTSAGSPTCCLVTTTDWPGDAVPIITLTAQDAAVTNIHLTGKPSFDGMCPVVEAMPCWELKVPVLPRDGVLIIDPARRQIRYRDPSLRIEKSGIRMVSWEGPLTYPEISPCSEFCVCAYTETGSATMTVSKVIREL